MGEISLADTILGLRREILDAQRQAETEQLKFKIDSIELELRVGATTKDVAKGGIKFWVVDAGLEGSVEVQKLQTVRLKLTPIPDGGGDTLIADIDTK